MDWFNYILIFLLCNCVSAYKLELSCESPIVLGATVHCSASIYDDDGRLAPSGDYRYYWINDFFPHMTREMSSSLSVDSWNITYNASDNYPGTYVVRVTVHSCTMFIICHQIDSKGIIVEVTDTLNGQLNISQANNQRDEFVSTLQPVHNSIQLVPSDKNYLLNATSTLSYWFVDCVYYGITSDLEFDFNFTKPGESHIIEALVMGDFTPPPPPTTPAPTTTLAPNATTTVKPTVPTTKPVTNATTALQHISPTTKRTKREVSTTASSSVVVNNSSTIKIWQNGSLVQYNVSFPYVCNSSYVVTDSKKVYGYFPKRFTTKAPISDLNISGTNWLRHGELLNLHVKCSGSKQMQYCILYKQGIYNVTNNETCEEFSNMDVCDFPIKHLFYGSDKNTVVVIVKNEVSTKVASVVVTVYKVKQQAQLSIIVVPVAFSLVAVVTIVFGVAYYLQNRSRIIVEVADFDFGQQYADMEYKTFKERLRDSIVNAFIRDPAASEAPNWPPGHKYGSMT